MSDDFHANLSQQIPHRILDKQQAEALRASDCSCLVYENYTKKADHYATFPPKLIAPLIQASVPRRCCPECGQAWAAVVEKTTSKHPDTWGATDNAGQFDDGEYHSRDGLGLRHGGNVTDYRPTCECGREDHIPGIVLDPFGGSGTVGMVAKQLMRRWVVMDISKPYLDEQAKIRTKTGVPSKGVEGLPLFDGLEEGY